MMNNALITTLAISAFSFPVAVQASLNGCSNAITGDKQTNVYFANGINTTLNEAQEVTALLLKVYQSPLEQAEENSTYHFKTAYNYSQGFVTDVVQVFQQKLSEDPDGSIAYMVYDLLRSGLSNDEIRATVTVALTRGNLVAALLTDELLQELGDSLAEVAADAMADGDLVNTNHSRLYSDALINGRRVLVVAHSQGNLFTNTAIAATLNKHPQYADSINYYGVASPAATTVNGADYVTADDDRVINLLRLTETVMAANIDNDPGLLNDTRELLNHSFLSSYFDGRLPSRARINAAITALSEQLTYPEVIAGEGAIRATLSWGDQPDVDLHVFEPGGSHVYYRNKTGEDGTLDVDDTTAVGPENYFVACDRVNEGSYAIGVNYFRGYQPEKALVTLYLGNGATFGPRSVTLNTARGSAGNDSPVSVYNIVVHQDDNGNALYTVQ
ncbi:YfaP family protein [Ferrimonas sediminum]|nr:hypothetical protein [Ferrimonas sediminum]